MVRSSTSRRTETTQLGLDPLPIVGMHGVDAGGAHQVLGVAAEQLGAGVVDLQPAAVEADQRPPHRRVVQRRGEAVLELVDPPFELPALGDVPGGDHDPPDGRLVEQVGGRHLEVPPGAVGAAGPQRHRGERRVGAPCAGEAGGRPVDVVGVDELEDRRPDLRGPIVAENPLGGLVRPPDDPGLVEDDDHVDVTLDQVGHDGDTGAPVDQLGDRAHAAIQAAGRIAVRSGQHPHRPGGAVRPEEADLGPQRFVAVEGLLPGALRPGPVVGVDEVGPGPAPRRVGRDAAQLTPPIADVGEGPRSRR